MVKNANLRRIVEVPDLSHGARLLYIWMNEHVGASRRLQARRDEMAEPLGVTTRSVDRYLVELEERGLISRENTFGRRPNVYTLLGEQDHKERTHGQRHVVSETVPADDRQPTDYGSL